MRINFKTLDADRRFLENKFHDTEKEFDSFKRWAYHGYEYDAETGLSDEEIRAGLLKIDEELAGAPHPTIKAKMFEYVLDNTRIDVNEHDYFVGFYTWGRPFIDITAKRWEGEIFNKLIGEDYSALYHAQEGCGAAWNWLDYDHTIPDWDSLMTLGFPGILKRINDSYGNAVKSGSLTDDMEIFYQAMKTEYEAILRLLDRFAKRAEAASHPKAKTVAECMKNLRDGAPKSTLDALEMIYLFFMLSEHVDNYQVRSLGYGLDCTLLPFVKRDLESGRFEEEEISEFIAYFLMQFSAIGNYWGQPVYLGGTGLDGKCKINDISYTVMEIYDKIGLYNPKVQIKVGKNTPNDFLRKVLEMVKGGNSSVVFINEDTVTRSLMSRGASYEEALDSAISGCYEYKIKAKSIDISSIYFNAAKCIEFVFSGGYDPISDMYVGKKTKPVEQMTSFEEFYGAYREQLEHLVKTSFDIILRAEEKVQLLNPSIMYSATIPACVEKLRDAMDSGIENTRGTLLNGFASAVDSLMAVYELVFEKKLTTLVELKAALNANWKGYERLRLLAKRAEHKFGRADKIADFYADAIHRHYHSLIADEKTAHGGDVSYELHSARSFILQAEKMGATPDGRFAGEEISKNASAAIGADTKGITALISSVTSIDLSLANGGGCLDAMLHPSAVMGEDGTDAFLAVLKTYMDKGGASIHFNIMNADILRDAQAHPENYKNLQVRVCGWNVLWNNMAKSEQDAYIKRAESII